MSWMKRSKIFPNGALLSANVSLSNESVLHKFLPFILWVVNAVVVITQNWCGFCIACMSRMGCRREKTRTDKVNQQSFCFSLDHWALREAWFKQFVLSQIIRRGIHSQCDNFSESFLVRIINNFLSFHAKIRW